jgi:hypothetical protein
MDMATERIVTRISHDRRLTLRFKIEQYDRYLTSGRFAQTYAAYGQFRHFTLFVTHGQCGNSFASVCAGFVRSAIPDKLIPAAVPNKVFLKGFRFRVSTVGLSLVFMFILSLSIIGLYYIIITVTIGFSS